MAGVDEGRLRQHFHLAYVSGHEAEGRLDKITDPVGRVTQFSYNSDGLIASIAIPAAENNALRTVYYTYDSVEPADGRALQRAGRHGGAHDLRL